MQKLIENEFDVDCAYQHRLPICAILQDPNLNIKDRLLCQQCILDIDKEKTILGWRKVQDNVQSHIMEKQRINSQLISPLLPLVKQVKSNIEFLKDSIMKEFRMIEETLEEWQLELSKEIKLLDGKQFISELEYIFGNQLTKISLDEILKRDLNQLNSITISKVQSKLNFFKEFEQYKICSNILNSIEEENFSLQINQSIDEKSNELDNQKNILSDSTQISHINSYTTQQSQIFQQEQSPQSKQINQDNMCNVQQLNQQQNVEQIQLKEGLSLPLIKLVTTKDGDPQYQYYGQQLNNSIQYRNILFIGQRDEGKTTLLNAFVNYYFGIAWDDTFRLIVADQEQTTEISHYYIEPFNQRNYGVHLIDTPGNYGQDDNYTINKVSNFYMIIKIQLILLLYVQRHTMQDLQWKHNKYYNHLFKQQENSQPIKLLLLVHFIQERMSINQYQHQNKAHFITYRHPYVQIIILNLIVCPQLKQQKQKCKSILQYQH